MSYCMILYFDTIIVLPDPFYKSNYEFSIIRPELT